MAALALEVDHGVDHVLEHARARDLALLGDVADQEQAGAPLLGEAEQEVGGGAQLGDGAGCRLQALDIDGLDRVDDDDGRCLRGVEAGHDLARGGGGGQLQRGAGYAEAAGTEPDLVEGFLAADIDDALAAAGERGCGLQRQRGLADAGVAADQDPGTGHDAAAQHPVQLLDAGAQTWRRGGGEVELDQLQPLAPTGVGGGASTGGRRLLDDTVPGAAGVAATGPARMHGTARLADEEAVAAGHGLRQAWERQTHPIWTATPNMPTRARDRLAGCMGHAFGIGSYRGQENLCRAVRLSPPLLPIAQGSQWDLIAVGKRDLPQPQPASAAAERRERPPELSRLHAPHSSAPRSAPAPGPGSSATAAAISSSLLRGGRVPGSGSLSSLPPFPVVPLLGPSGIAQGDRLCGQLSVSSSTGSTISTTTRVSSMPG